MSENSRSDDVAINLLSDVSDDALTILRLNIFIIGVYVSVIAISIRQGQDMGSILDSSYTFFGFFTWVGGVIVTVYLYFATRTMGLVRSRDDIETHPNHNLFTIRTLLFSSIVGVLSTIISFSFGYYDGLTESPLPLTQVAEILGGGTLLLFLISTYTLIGILGLFTLYSKWSQLRNWMGDSSKEDIHQMALDQLGELRDSKDESIAEGEK